MTHVSIDAKELELTIEDKGSGETYRVRLYIRAEIVGDSLEVKLN